MMKAIEFEAYRQIEVIESGSKVKHETRLYDQNKNEDIEPISGTKIRNALINGDTIPNTFIRKNIMEFLKERMDNDKPVFVE